MDVGVWLRNLGLGQYEAAFSDNEVDVAVLPKLTVDDLKDLGVAVVGHRRKIMSAIEELNAESLARTDAMEALPTQAALPVSASPDGAERRPITILFCDLVGSTNLAARLDAEDWRNLVNGYLDEASAAVTDLGGHVLKKLGDGLMALFGYPRAQENDAERAVRAALAIQRSLADLNGRNARSGAPELSARIGIECGSVVVDASGEVFGEAPNVAARVQAAAEPGSVLVTGSVQRQVAGLFVVEEKGAHELKGVAQPVSLYRVVRASGGGRRGGMRALTSFVGREEDIGTLLRRWDRVRAGEGQFVQIIGEPGLGKSRLVEEFHSRLGETPHTWVEWNSSQLLQNTPLHPVAEWGRARFGGQDVAAEKRLADLETTLAQVKLDVQETATLLAPLLDIPLPAERALKFGPEELRRRQLAAMVALLLAGARTQPVVLAFEDLHWADPTSLDLIQALAERGAQAPLLVVATTRPEFRAPWGMRSHHAVVALAPLDWNEVRRMVGDIAAQHALPQDVVERVSERTGGVPLFVEEVTRLLVERGEQGGVQAIPPTLQQSLAARLDRLGPAREVAQIGAVLGRNFVYAMLRDVAEIDEPALQASLDRLADADLLFVEGAPPEANYRFKHALIQDAAYDSLLKSRRQVLHRRAAELLRDDAERAAAEPEVIAHHFTQAGLDDLAIEWWGKAGDQALRRSAFQEAIAHLGKAIAMADKAGNADSRKLADLPASQKMKLHADLSQATMFAKGYTAKETKEAFARLEEAAQQIGDTKPSFTDFYARWVVDLMQGRHAKAKEAAQAFLRAAQSGGGTTEIAAAHRALGWSCFALGELQSAFSEYRSGLDLLRATADDDSRFRFGMDTRGSADGYRSCACWIAGDGEEWRAAKAAALARAEALGHVPTSVNVYISAAIASTIRRDAEAARSEARRVIDLSQTHGLPQYLAYGEICLGWALANLDSADAGVSMLRRALDDQEEQDGRYWRPWYLGLSAALELTANNLEAALRTCNDALALAKETGEAWSDAALLRLRGDILLRLDPNDHAAVERTYDEAVRTARAQGARTFELQAALALAKLHQSTGRPAEAHTVLASALEGFSATPEMPEIAEAQALLAALAETEEVKAAEAQRRRRLHLQTAYGQAMMWGKGFAAEEARAAFSRATELTAKSDDFAERFAAAHFQWTLAFLRGELRSARALESSFLKEAEDNGRVVEAGVALRGLALACYQAGDFVEARIHCERALKICEPDNERETQERFHDATGPIVISVLSVTMWQLGEAERAREMIDKARQRARDLGHGPSMTHPLLWGSHLEILRGDAAAALSAAEALAELGLERAMPFWRTAGEMTAGWARGRLRDAEEGAADLRRALAERAAQGARVDGWLHTLLLAELEAKTLGVERALARIDEAMALARQVEIRCNLALPHLLRGELLLKRDPSNAASAEQSFLAALDIAKEQGARSWGLRAAFALAKLYQSTNCPANAHAVLAPALEGFTSTPEMPEIAKAQALLVALADKKEVKAEAARRQRLTQLQAAYGNALIAARGYGAPETIEAFAIARESASGDKDAPGRLSADYGLWASSYVRGELPAMRAHAAVFLCDVEAKPDSGEAGVAHRVQGITHQFAGEYLEARHHLERALALFQPGRDDDLAFRFGHDAGVAAMVYLSMVLWPLGEVDRAISLIDRMQTLIAGTSHIGTHGMGKTHAALFELMRGHRARAALHALELATITRGHDLPMFHAFSMFLEGWAALQSGAPAQGLEDMRRGVELLRERNALHLDGLLKIALAEAEARAGDEDRAIAILHEALATVDRLGYRAFEAELHRARGEILLKRDPAIPAPAEEAFLTAIAVAKQQGTRSFELRAALSLAELYQSNGRVVDAHAVLAPALEGFSPTSEMPEIAEAQALVSALSENDEVKAEAARRQRLTQLHVARGVALFAARGGGAPETTEAFPRGRGWSFGDENAPGRLVADFGLWVGSYVRGELPSMRTHAAAFLKDVTARPDSPEVGVAHRTAGITSWFAGEYGDARDHLERALALFQPGRDDDLTFRFGLDPGIATMVNLANASWPLGEVDRAISLIDRAQRRSADFTHAGVLAFGRMHSALFDLMRRDHARAAPRAFELAKLAREHELTMYGAFGAFLEGWASAAGGAPGSGLADMRRAVDDLREQNVLLFDGLLKIALAEAEARAGDADRAIAILDEALATSNRTGYRAFEAELHRARGEILLMRDSANPAPAEEAFLSAIAVAKQQGTRSFELRAALALAKLRQSTDRPSDAHAILAPALAGFAPTDEMPEIAEAQALLVAIEAGAHARHE